MSHEKSITVGLGSKFYNLATVDRKKKRTMTVDEAVKGEPLGGKGYITQEGAVRAAVKRSREHGKHKHGIKDILGE